MSRSCQSATFSIAAIALPRSRRARPTTCSHPIGLRLCGMADEPFWPVSNGSSISPISVFWRPRISSANFSSDAAAMARADSSSAWRSRWMTWDDTGAGSRPSRAHTAASMDGSRCANVPTAPDSLPTLIPARARCTRSMFRWFSAYQRASFRPSEIGSAWTPCVRPIIGVWRCSSARARMASPSLASPSRIRSHASRIWSAWAVSMTSDEVRPKWSQRASSPTFSATAVVKAMTSCLVFASISSMRAMSNAPRSRIAARRGRRDDAGLGHRLGRRDLDLQPALEAPLLAPDPAHRRTGVTRDHRGPPSDARL